MERASRGEVSIPPEATKDFADSCRESVLTQLNKLKEYKIRMSGLGRPICQQLLESQGVEQETEYNLLFRFFAYWTERNNWALYFGALNGWIYGACIKGISLCLFALWFVGNTTRQRLKRSFSHRSHSIAPRLYHVVPSCHLFLASSSHLAFPHWSISF